MSVNIADIGSVEIYQFPKLREPFRFTVKVGPTAQAADPRTFWFRARDADVAKKLADAFATLAAAGRGSITLEMPQPAFGISARTLNAEEMRQAGVESGLYVGSVDAGSPGERLGILRDDYLLEIDGTKVVDLATAQRQLRTAPVQSVKIWRSGKIVILRALTKM
jgi:S1-C subfamily serine protease